MFLPKEDPPGLDRMAVSDGIQIFVHFLLVQLNQIHRFVELLPALPHLLGRLLTLLELEQRCCEGLHNSEQLLLQHSGGGVGVDENDHLVMEISESLEAELVNGFEVCEPSGYSVYGP